MKTGVTIILIISLIGNIVGAYFLYKALKLREEVKRFQKYHKDLKDKHEELKADFAGLSVYAEENRRLLESQKSEERKKMTVLFGASITKGWDLAKYFPVRKLLNRGIGSQSDQQLLVRFSSDVISLSPGSVVIKFCSGNFRPGVDIDAMWYEFEMMALMARQYGIMPLPATVIPATRAAEEFSGYSIAGEVKAINDRIRNLARERSYPLVDYYAAMADSEGFLPDSLARDAIHPNEKGYELMAKVLNPVLDRL